MGASSSNVKYSPEGVRIYSLDDFENKRILYSEVNSVVYKGYGTIRNRTTTEKQWVALKLSKRREFQKEEQLDLKRLCQGLLDHPNIVNLYGLLVVPDDIEYLSGYVMECVNGGSLHNYIYDSATHYDLRKICEWICQIAKGVEFLHKNGLIHGNLKPSNVLVDVLPSNSDLLKISDFQCGKTADLDFTPIENPYTAPEVFISKMYSSASDIYSLSITIWEIFHRKKPQESLRTARLKVAIPIPGRTIQEIRPIINPNKMDNEVAAFVQRSWQQMAENRPSIKEIFSFFAQKPYKAFALARYSIELSDGGPVSTDYEYLTAAGKESSSQTEKTDRDIILQMYESQAIAIIKQSEIDILQKEKEELIQRLLIMKELNESEKKRRYIEIPSKTADKHELGLEKDDQQRKTVLLIGGMRNDHTGYAGMTVLSSDRSKWVETELELPYEARGSGAVYLNNEIYLFGGFRNPRALYKLNPNFRWIQLADMNARRTWITNSCLVWNGCIWVFGGKDDEFNRLKSVERYDPRENKWTLMPEMNHSRSGAATVLWNDTIFITGGFSEDGRTDSVECFDLEDNCWMDLPSMPNRLSYHSFIFYKKKLLAMGGHNGEICKDVWEIDPHKINAKWKPLARMKCSASHFGGVVLDSEVYAIGGCLVEYLPQDRVEIYNGDGWRDGPSLPYRGGYMSAVIIPQQFADLLTSNCFPGDCSPMDYD